VADSAQEAIFAELERFLGPLVRTQGDADLVLAYFASIGWNLDVALGGAAPAQFASAVRNLVTHASELRDLADHPPSGIPELLLALAKSGVPIAADIKSLGQALPAGLPSSLQELPGDLLNALVVEYIRGRFRVAYALLELTGLVAKLPEQKELFNGNLLRTKNAIPVVDFAQVNRIIRKPDEAMVATYWPAGFNDGGAGVVRFAQGVFRLSQALGIQPPRSGALGLGEDDEDFAFLVQGDRLRLAKQFPIDDFGETTVGVDLEYVNPAAGGPAAVVKPFGTWQLDQGLGAFLATLKGNATAGQLRASESGVELQIAGGAALDAELKVARDLAPDANLFLLGDLKSTFLRLKNAEFGCKLVFAPASRALTFSLALKEFELGIAAGEGDGFLQALLPEGGIHSRVDLEIDWSTQGGLTFRGGGFEIQLPSHIVLGPIELQAITIALKIDDPKMPLDLGLSVRGNLGPLVVVVENLGLRTTVTFPPGGGNLGPLDLNASFKPPNGVGLSIDAGVVKGGGYLFFDFDREEYAGALELTISDFLSLKAIGLVTTRMPDGSKGFSLLIIITAEFSPGLQLGYGFTLIGVGGLLGLNRTVVLDFLAIGVRTGAVNGIMFPVDPVANAPRIISDLRAIFPPKQDVFLIGPMAKLGWGTPTLVSLALGVIIEIPGNVAILGVLKVALPTEEAALIKLQVNFVGAIEFDKKRGWFFAALFESRVLFITLEGEMGMLIAIGDDANFVLSVGGFHPRFSPPPLPFPSPRRILFDIVNTPVCRIRVEGYFAVTTNTAQFGARAELYFGFSVFSVEGHIAFDALMRFSPFYFIVEISAGVSLKAFGVGVFSIDLEFTLEGTTPWHARGRGSISLLFFSISADFDETWGESRDTTLPPIQIIPLITAEVQNIANWRTLPPVGSNLLVSLRKLALPAETLVLHPLGTLEVSQRAMPLGMQLDKIGAQKPSDANRVVLRVKAGGLARKGDATNAFAPTQFKDMNDAQKLSAPAFETMSSGLQLGVDGNELTTGAAVKRVVRYEIVTIDTNYRRFVGRFRRLAGALFRHFLLGNAAARSSLSAKHKHDLQPYSDKVKVHGDAFVVARTSDNRPVAADSTFASHAAAHDYLLRSAANDPNLGKGLHVIPASELNAA
jgi:hypothetical protein